MFCFQLLVAYRLLSTSGKCHLFARAESIPPFASSHTLYDAPSCSVSEPYKLEIGGKLLGNQWCKRQPLSPNLCYGGINASKGADTSAWEAIPKGFQYHRWRSYANGPASLRENWPIAQGSAGTRLAGWSTARMHATIPLISLLRLWERCARD